VGVARVARQAGIRRILGEIGATGDRPATTEGARAFRLALEELGTTYIKLGQLLSSRPDLLPDVYAEELERLVDSVPPVPYETLRPTIEGDIGPDTFVRIDEEPLAAASIAQIHAAVLKDGRAVVVKVRRPGVEEQVARDLELLRSTTRLAESRSERARVLRLEALADELEAHLLDELDLREEANNADVIGRNLADVDEIVVPRVVRPYVTERVLVLERLDGRRIAPGHGLPPDRARLLARTFFRATASTTPTRTAATSCSPTTAGSRCSTSACWGGWTTTCAASSRSSCWPWRTTVPTTSRASSSPSR